VCLDQYHLGDLASTLVCYGEVSSAVRCAVEAKRGSIFTRREST
jgi:hypothetical protein